MWAYCSVKVRGYHITNYLFSLRAVITTTSIIFCEKLSMKKLKKEVTRWRRWWRKFSFHVVGRENSSSDLFLLKLFLLLSVGAPSLTCAVVVLADRKRWSRTRGSHEFSSWVRAWSSWVDENSLNFRIGYQQNKKDNNFTSCSCILHYFTNEESKWL